LLEVLQHLGLARELGIAHASHPLAAFVHFVHFALDMLEVYCCYIGVHLECSKQQLEEETLQSSPEDQNSLGGLEDPGIHVVSGDLVLEVS
jgi:hypothetical protein